MWQDVTGPLNARSAASCVHNNDHTVLHCPGVEMMPQCSKIVVVSDAMMTAPYHVFSFVDYVTMVSVTGLHSIKWKDDRWIWKDLEESGHGRIEVLAQHLPRWTPQTTWVSVLPKILIEHLPPTWLKILDLQSVVLRKLSYSVAIPAKDWSQISFAQVLNKNITKLTISVKMLFSTDSCVNGINLSSPRFHYLEVYFTVLNLYG